MRFFRPAVFDSLLCSQDIEGLPLKIHIDGDCKIVVTK